MSELKPCPHGCVDGKLLGYVAFKGGPFVSKPCPIHGGNAEGTDLSQPSAYPPAPTMAAGGAMLSDGDIDDIVKNWNFAGGSVYALVAQAKLANRLLKEKR